MTAVSIERKGGWIQTFTGRQFWPMDARPEDIDIRDVAHGTANTCRYGGHTRLFYSVAQHSVLVSQMVAPEHALWGLLHDATEAYFGDIPRPLKHGAGLGVYRQAEARLAKVVAERFGLPWPIPHEVKDMDAVLLWTERRDLMPPPPPVSQEDWAHGASIVEPLDFHIHPLVPLAAKQLFLYRYTELTREDSLRGD